MIRDLKKTDESYINKLGLELHENYKLNLDVFSKCIVCCENENILGFCVYSIIYDRAEIIDIIIDSKYRNNGYASQLINYVINNAINNKCSNITLEVKSDNKTAISFYENIGFKKIKTINDYYKDNNIYTDANLMILEL